MSNFFWIYVLVFTLISVGLVWKLSVWLNDKNEEALLDAKKEERRQLKKAAEEKRIKDDLAKPSKVISTIVDAVNNDIEKSRRHGRKPTVLLVEDSPTMQLTLRKILEKRDYMVQTAKDGKDAWSMLKEKRPDLVISDIDMPIMNGLELVGLMRSDISLIDVPVILITGSPFYHAAASHQAGIEGLLAKPFEDKVLLEQVKYVLQD